MNDHVHGRAAYQRLRRLGETCPECKAAVAADARERRAAKKVEPRRKKPAAAKAAPAIEIPENAIRYLAIAALGEGHWSVAVEALEPETRTRHRIEELTVTSTIAAFIERALELVAEHRVQVLLGATHDLVGTIGKNQPSFAGKLQKLGARPCVVSDPDWRHLELRGSRAATLAEDHAGMLVKASEVLHGREELEAQQEETADVVDGHRVVGATVARGKIDGYADERYAKPEPVYEPIPFDSPILRNETWIGPPPAKKKPPWAARR